MYIEKKVLELDTTDNVVNLGYVKSIEVFPNGSIVNFENGFSKFMQNKEVLIIEKSKLDNIFKRK